MPAKPVPDTYHTVTPYLVVKRAAQLVDFITRAFGAREVHMMKGPNGEVRHGDFTVGDSHVMLGEASGPWPSQPCSLYVYLPDCDATYKQAVAAGGTSVQEPKTQFLWRSTRRGQGSVREYVVDRDARGRRVAVRIGATRRRSGASVGADL